MITVMVTGGRDYQDRDRVFLELDRLDEERVVGEIMHGACGWDADLFWTQYDHLLQGADRWADEWAREKGAYLSRYPAHWNALGPKAGPIRNQKMVDMSPELVLAFPGGKGTARAVEFARKARIPVVEVSK